MGCCCKVGFGLLLSLPSGSLRGLLVKGARKHDATRSECRGFGSVLGHHQGL